jgi:hypothetical protein
LDYDSAANNDDKEKKQHISNRKGRILKDEEENKYLDIRDNNN